MSRFLLESNRKVLRDLSTSKRKSCQETAGRVFIEAGVVVITNEKSAWRLESPESQPARGPKRFPRPGALALSDPWLLGFCASPGRQKRESRATEDTRKGEAVAHAWYWTKDGKIAGLYVRNSPSNPDRFTMEEPDGTVHKGPGHEIAGKYAAAGTMLRRDGQRRSSVMGSGDYPDFILA